MIDIDEIERNINKQVETISELESSLNINELTNKLEELQKLTYAEDFWNDRDNSSKILAQISNLKKEITDFNSIKNKINNCKEMFDIVKEENDEQMLIDIEKDAKNNQKELEDFQIITLLDEKYDNSNAIITIHPGAGGTEAMDWAQMLYRMYNRYCLNHGFQFEELDYLPGEEAGAKSVTFLVSGTNAYGMLKSESGVHRLVRISPFDAGGRRHTSFASVDVIPEIEDDTDVVINPNDIKMDVFRASGAGGQHINKTSSAVRLTHIPTGIVVSCQTQRSQFQNRDYAMKMLISKLVNLKEKANKDRIEDLQGIKMDIAWGSQIRSYVFCPYTLVKDHRTNYEVGNVEDVMDGNIDGFINSYLKFIKTSKQ